MPRFVLEIGTEEIPPRFFPPALAQLRRDGRQMLERARLGFEDVKVYGTPRRLVLIAEDIGARQAPETREERGPSAKVAFDADGSPTKAAEGFARRHGLAPEQLVKKETDQGEYVFAVVKAPELPAGEALAGLLPDLIAGLSFPKTMRWGTGKLRFGRPIRWLLALVDDEIVGFELEGLKSNRLTRGHPVLSDGMHQVRNADEYESTLEDHCVMVRQGQRRLLLRERIRELSGQENALPLGVGHVFPTIDTLMEWPDEFLRQIPGDLLLETVFLVEWPTVALGRFDPSFLSLPDPILIEEMQHVQSYFPLQTQEWVGESRESLPEGSAFWGGHRPGRLLPRFIAVRDGDERHLDTVVAGWENVLRAKLIDASFFYEQDLKRPLSDRVEDLRGVVFQEGLGTVYDKVQRIRAVASDLAGQDSLSSADRKALGAAALLCKADLTTEVVAELSGLQGVMGGIYARTIEPTQADEVADAISDHYRPRFSDDEIPGTVLSQLLAVADKIDTIAALFAIGAVPTGSADPFGLRREAAGVVAIVLGADLFVSSRRLVEVALTELERQVELKQPRNRIVSDVLAFLGQRLQTHLREEEGIRYDLVEAALAPGIDDISAAATRAQALRLIQPHDSFLPTVIACTRPMNISKDFEGGDVDPELFQDPSENALWEAYQKVASQADDVPLLKLFELIATDLRASIDTYFDDVLVMAKDEKLRRNRLAMCWQLSQLFRRIADFSLIVQA